uniref:T33-fn10: engineered DrsE like sulfur reductase n=1 Tax=Sulfurisphaera tokodaii (strain DSM 16993 / JCM 10545 / NBRC 100140 / 7) TaxID=273063 RepID=UPI003003A6C1
MKVVVQIKDFDKVPQALQSVLNLFLDLGNAEIEVVLHQSAIKALLLNSPTRSIIEELIKLNILIVGCEHSIRSQNLDHRQLIDGIKIVRSGVGEIVRKQSEGWIYLAL